MAKDADIYDVEKIIMICIRSYEKKIITQYLLRWKGYDPEHDKWRG